MKKRFISLVTVIILIIFAYFYFDRLATPPLSIQEISNISVPADWNDGEMVTLKNGLYKENLNEGKDNQKNLPSTVFSMQLLNESSTFAVTDLNNDGVEDILFTTVGTSGGSGWFYVLNAYINEKGVPKYAGRLFLGDRIKINKISADGNRVTVDIITQGPNEGMCCGTLRQVKNYTFDGKNFKEI